MWLNVDWRFKCFVEAIISDIGLVYLPICIYMLQKIPPDFEFYVDIIYNLGLFMFINDIELPIS